MALPPEKKDSKFAIWWVIWVVAVGLGLWTVGRPVITAVVVDEK